MTKAALAIHPGALGDVLLAIPALRALRAASDGLTLAAQSHIAALLVALGEADGASDFESLRLDALMAGDDRARLPAATRIVCWFGARDPYFPRRLAALAPRVTVAPSTSPERDVWEHLLATVGDDAARARREVVQVNETLRNHGRAALTAAGVDTTRRVVVVHPGAGGRAKRWPAAAFAEVVAAASTRPDVAIVIHEGPADVDAVAQVSSLVRAARVLRAPALPALAGVLSRCTAYVGNDSGISHLAAAVGAPAIVLFSSSNLAWRPWAGAPRLLTVPMGRAVEADVRAVRQAFEALLE